MSCRDRRTRCSAPSSCRKCFKPGGARHDFEVEPEGMMALFRGAVSVFKNPASHREVTFEDPRSRPKSLFADLLLRLLDARAATLGLDS